MAVGVAFALGAGAAAAHTNGLGFEPVKLIADGAEIRAEVIGSYRTGFFKSDGAMFTAYDPGAKRLFVVNAGDAPGLDRAVDALDIADPFRPQLAFAINVGDLGVPTSVAFKNGLVAVTLANPDPLLAGQVAFFDPDGNLLNQVEVGVGPAMAAFTPGGRYLVTADSGMIAKDFSVDPEGTVSLINLSRGVAAATVERIGFEAFNDREDELIASGVRIINPFSTVAEDLEPEYLTVSADSRTIWVTLQDNNALARIDRRRREVTDLLPLGRKDHGAPGNGLDASDRDDLINIRPWPVLGMYQPDAIAAYRVGDETFLVTANEGDPRKIPDDEGGELDEDIKVGDDEVVLDPTVFPDGAALKANEALGRLKISRLEGDLDGDGDFDELHAFGARSFAIWTADGELAFDSGDQFARITAEAVPEFFNTTDDENAFDDRSDARGSEPEALALGKVGGRPYAFVGLERIGGIMVFDVSDPRAPEFVLYINNRNFANDPDALCVEDDDMAVPETPECARAGDLAPEHLLFIPAGASPIDSALLVAANQTSGSTTIYRVRPWPDD